MRHWITLIEEANSFSGIAYHGCDGDFQNNHIDPERGVYFASDYGYASGYGNDVYKCQVELRNPIHYTGEEAEGSMEIERPILIHQGYDGRIITYDDGEMDIIAFYPNQFVIMDKVTAS